MVKRCIAKGIPVVAGMQIRTNFKYLNKNDGYWNPEKGDTTLLEEGHSLVIVGYDDRKDAFEVFNSWGSDWGDEGFAWIKYRDFDRYCLFAYQYILREEMPDTLYEISPISMSGKFTFRYDPSFDEAGAIQFNYIQPILKKDYFYQMDKKDWEIADQFQLVVEEMKKGQHLYIFSFDQEGLNPHWPRPEESAIIPYKQTDVIIPNENRALTKRVGGDDHICILYSAEQIVNYQAKLELFKNFQVVLKIVFYMPLVIY